MMTPFNINLVQQKTVFNMYEKSPSLGSALKKLQNLHGK